MTLSRAAALVILLGLAAAVWLGPGSAYLDLVGTGAMRRERAEQKLEHERALLQEPPAATAGIDGRTVLLPENSDAQAAALLQEMLKSAASAAQVDIQGLQVLPSETLPGASRIAVRLKGRGDLAGLDRLLYAIEASRPLLYPDNLQIQSRALQPAAPAAPLDFQLDVAGFKAGPPA